MPEKLHQMQFQRYKVQKVRFWVQVEEKWPVQKEEVIITYSRLLKLPFAEELYECFLTKSVYSVCCKILTERMHTLDMYDTRHT